MGSLIGGGSPPPALPPALPPAPPKAPTRLDNEAAQAAADTERRRQAGMQGRQSTILTSGYGVEQDDSENTTKRKKALGA